MAHSYLQILPEMHKIASIILPGSSANYFDQHNSLIYQFMTKDAIFTNVPMRHHNGGSNC